MRFFPIEMDKKWPKPGIFGIHTDVLVAAAERRFSGCDQ
jgi:hypothetical protein